MHSIMFDTIYIKWIVYVHFRFCRSLPSLSILLFNSLFLELLLGLNRIRNVFFEFAPFIHFYQIHAQIWVLYWRFEGWLKAIADVLVKFHKVVDMYIVDVAWYSCHNWIFNWDFADNGFLPKIVSIRQIINF